jgi:hypothetical protein
VPPPPAVGLLDPPLYLIGDPPLGAMVLCET